jgi:hypothetical protein
LKRTLLPLLLLGASALTFADSVADFQGAANYDVRFAKATYTINNNGVASTGAFPFGQTTMISKAAGSLNGVGSLAQMYPTLGINLPVTFTGTNLGSNKLRVDLSCAGLAGQTISLTVAGHTYSVLVQTFGGSLNFVASKLPKPLMDIFSGKARNTSLAQDTATLSTLDLTGTSGGHPFQFHLTSGTAAGLGGPAVDNYVQELKFSSAPIFTGEVQGGLPGTITITLAKAPTVNTVVNLTYFGTASVNGFSAPATATVLAGHTTGTATVTTATASQLEVFTYNASFNGYMDKSDPTYVVPRLAYFTFDGVAKPGFSQLPSGRTVSVALHTLTAVSGATVVSLYTSNPDLAIPPTVTIPSGGTAAAFLMKTPLAPEGSDAVIYGRFPGAVGDMVIGIAFLGS